jgi:hypothetical protein
MTWCLIKFTDNFILSTELEILHQSLVYRGFQLIPRFGNRGSPFGIVSNFIEIRVISELEYMDVAVIHSV